MVIAVKCFINKCFNTFTNMEWKQCFLFKKKKKEEITLGVGADKEGR